MQSKYSYIHPYVLRTNACRLKSLVRHFCPLQANHTLRLHQTTSQKQLLVGPGQWPSSRPQMEFNEMLVQTVKSSTPTLCGHTFMLYTHMNAYEMHMN